MSCISWSFDFAQIYSIFASDLRVPFFFFFKSQMQVQLCRGKWMSANGCPTELLILKDFGIFMTKVGI